MLRPFPPRPSFFPGSRLIFRVFSLICNSFRWGSLYLGFFRRAAVWCHWVIPEFRAVFFRSSFSGEFMRFIWRIINGPFLNCGRLIFRAFAVTGATNEGSAPLEVVFPPTLNARFGLRARFSLSLVFLSLRWIISSMSTFLSESTSHRTLWSISWPVPFCGSLFGRILSIFGFHRSVASFSHAGLWLFVIFQEFLPRVIF